MKTRFSLFLCLVVMTVFISACGGSQPSQSLATGCEALAKGVYKTAYNQLAGDLPSQLGFKSEAEFAAGVKRTTCKVNSVNDSAGTGTITYILPSGAISLDDETMNNGQIVKQTARSTPTVTLTNFCAALKAGDYQTAYNQFSTKLQAQVGTVDQYVASLGSAKVTDCTVSNIDDSAGTGTIALVTSNGPGTFNDTLVNQNGTWKIDSSQAQATPTPSAASTPTTTLQAYCDALKGGDYHTAYNLLSSAAQSQTSETQFAASFSNKATDCTLSNVNDTAGTGTISYTHPDRSTQRSDHNLVHAHCTGGIDSPKTHSPGRSER